jgi:hypothetical protein
MIVGLLGWWYVRAAPHHVAPFLTSVRRAFPKKKKKKANKCRKSARMASSQAAMTEPKIPGRIGVQYHDVKLGDCPAVVMETLATVPTKMRIEKHGRTQDL